jgi:choline dehydrogenase-like flavoprotein
LGDRRLRDVLALCASTNATVYAIAERAADLILASSSASGTPCRTA